MFSIVILTLNEEANLPLCLASTAGCDDVVVLDSGSTDRTADLARAAGARVFVRRFDNFAEQRNFAQTEIPFRHSWVFHLDADEQLTPELVEACRMMSQRTDIDGAYVAPKMLFMGRWIPHCTDYPAWQARFARAPQFRFVEVGHGQREAPDMRLAYLQPGYLHDLSASGEAEWIEKHRRYARAEARDHKSDRSVLPWGDLLARDALARRRALKRASHVLPCRSAFRFIYQYFIRRGFLDGRAGLRYCQLLARYEGFVTEERKKIAAHAR